MPRPPTALSQPKGNCRSMSLPTPPDGSSLASEYEDYRRIAHALMRRERKGHTLSATDVLHAALVRCGWNRVGMDDSGRLRIVVAAMRRVLIEYARWRNADKRGGGWTRIALDFDDAPSNSELTRKADWFAAREIDLEDLDRELRALEARHPELGDVVALKIFGGLKADHINTCLGITDAQACWTKAIDELRKHFDTHSDSERAQ
jgi:DNA-directed RNA polymerase specialized sigma24 family protein